MDVQEKNVILHCIETLVAARRIREALAVLSDHLQSGQVGVGILEDVGEILVRHEHREEARMIFEAALRLQPGAPGPSLRLAQLLKDAGNPGTAVEVLRAALIGHGENESLPPALGEALVESQHMIQALSTFRNLREVVFVGDLQRSRQAKIARGLREAGWRTVLLKKNAPNSIMKTCFNEVRAYRDEQEALALAHTYTSRAFHVFSIRSEKTSVALIRHKPGPIVCDFWDLGTTLHDPGAEREVPDQRFCLENADALCSRDFRPQWLKRAMKARADYSMRTQIPRLITFYEQL